MRSIHVAAALILVALPLSGCKKEKVAEKSHPATLEETAEKGVMRVRLTERAAERIGLQTAAVREEAVGTQTRKIVPYGALMYDKKGETWTFVNPEPGVFVRRKIAVESIEGDRAILAEGPPTGTAVVTVGAAELMGVEHKYGH